MQLSSLPFETSLPLAEADLMHPPSLSAEMVNSPH